MKHLSDFEVRSFRNVRPTKLEFRPGLNVVLGKNAAGKTSLLKLLAGSLSGISPDPLQEERAVELRLVDADASLGQSVARTRTGETGPRGVALFATRDSYAINIPGLAVNAEIRDGEVVVDGVSNPGGESPLVTLLRSLEKRPGFDRLLNLVFTSTARLDEALDYFQLLLGFWQTRNGERVSNSFWDGLPESLSRFEVSLTGKDGPMFRAAFLTKAAQVMGYDAAEGRVDVETKATGASVETKFTSLRFAFAHGADRFLHHSLSYGERRLLAFFAMSDACPEIMIVDELINGLHHDWIRACLSEIGERQAFLTSQNPLLLDYLEFEDSEDVRRGFVLCERVKGESGLTELVWRNPTQAEASEFFAAYETGLQSVSEILISKGFW